jgi:hypothetical protein
MFNHTTSGYSLSDIAAVTGTNNGRNGGFGDDAWWIIILLLCGWGNGGYGFGGGNGQGTVREEISYGFDMNGLENGVRGIQQGLCDGFYAVNTGMLNGFNGVQNALCQGFSGINGAITQSTIADMQSDFALQTAINNSTTALTGQLTNMAADNAACCCDLKTLIATQGCDTRRAIADSTRDIIDSNNAGVRSILDFLTQDKIASLTAENQSLKFAASQAAQNAFITANQEAQTAELIRRLSEPCPVPAYVVPNPNCCYDARVTFGNNCGACTNF